MMNEKRIQKLLSSGLRMIDISLDAFKEDTYAAIRVGGDLRVVRKNVLDFIEMAKGTNTKIVVSYVEQEKNRGEVGAFEEFWKEAGAHVLIRRLHSAAGFLPIQFGGKRRPCLYPWERIVLNPAGWLTFCPQEWFGGVMVADYRRTTIKEVWSSPFYKDLRTKHLEGRCTGVCEKCPDWAQTRWPWEGESYADMVAEMS
jgi:MoaA/NifB/PqqE/SkfB family radical SAM enzyme